MSHVKEQIKKNYKHLRLLSKQYPTIQSIYTEIINLRAILNLPKGTEHFMSDIHGEYEAFTHILNNCSGVVREKVDDLYADKLDERSRSELCALIYYPEKKLKQIREELEDLDEWYAETLTQMLDVCKVISSKYTRSKVRKAMPQEFSYILDELLHAEYDGGNQSMYYNVIMESILALSSADQFIIALASLIKRLAVDRLHIVGDIFDRGPRADLVMDMLTAHHSVDIQWGNHDILWMGAAAGNPACIAGVISGSAAYGNLKVLEEGYGINLRPLALFAEKAYGESDSFRPRIVEQEDRLTSQDAVLAGKMYKAISIIMFKVSGQILARHPELHMEDRLLLDKIDFRKRTVLLDGMEYPITDSVMPTVNPAAPYALTGEEAQVMEVLTASFMHSERLNRHIRFLYSNGGMYNIFNQNLMFHGCIPMNKDGSFTEVELMGKKTRGRALLDHCESIARLAYFGTGERREHAADLMWYFWSGSNSPLFGRHRMTTFEHLLIADKDTWTENKNPYYRHVQEEEHCVRILEEFGLSSEISHIINGHVPVRVGDGESPIKGGGKLVVIDGGLCKAYHPRTGIAGYTLIYNSYGLRLSAHKPFESIQKAVEENMDIHSTTSIFETMQQRMRVMDTDIGQELSEQIYDLSLLLEGYRSGLL